jgi:hypothetical protein
MTSSNGDLTWIKYFGGDNNDGLSSIDVSSDGSSIYMTGFSSSTGLTHGNEDIIIVKLDSSSGNTQWVKYVGGGANDIGRDIIATSSAVYVLGDGSSPGMTNGGSDIYLLKLDSSGNS